MLSQHFICRFARVSLGVSSALAAVVTIAAIQAAHPGDRVEFRSSKGFRFYSPKSWQSVSADMHEMSQGNIDRNQTPSVTLEYMIQRRKDPSCSLNLLQLPHLDINPKDLADLADWVWSEGRRASVTITDFKSKVVFVANHLCLLSSWTADRTLADMYSDQNGIVHEDWSMVEALKEPLFQRQLMIFGNQHCYIITASSRKASRAEADRAFLMVAHSFSIDKGQDQPETYLDSTKRMHILDLMQRLPGGNPYH